MYLHIVIFALQRIFSLILKQRANIAAHLDEGKCLKLNKIKDNDFAILNRIFCLFNID